MHPTTVTANERRPGRAAAALVTASTAAATGGLACWVLARVATSSWAAVQRPDPLPDDAIALIAAVTGLVLCGWWTLGATVTALATLAEGGAHGAGRLARAGRAITPGVLHRAVVLGVGMSLVAGGTAANAATIADPRPDPPAVRISDVAGLGAAPRDPMDPGWGARAPDAAAPTGSRSTAPGVVVGPGDTLWGLAARNLAARNLNARNLAAATARRPTDAQIARAWPGWFAANRAVIGADPDHLEPGQHLVPPHTLEEDS